MENKEKKKVLGSACNYSILIKVKTNSVTACTMSIQTQWRHIMQQTILTVLTSAAASCMGKNNSSLSFYIHHIESTFIRTCPVLVEVTVYLTLIKYLTSKVKAVPKMVQECSRPFGACKISNLLVWL